MGYMDEVGDKMMEGLVSVVIPVYNRENTIKRAIDSVLCQTYANLEVIIVDDGSTDNTVEIVKGYEDRRIRLICQKENGGANKARNIGIANSRGEYIAFQDSDDEWLPDKLHIQINQMETKGYMACYSAYNFYENEIRLTVPFYYSNIEKYQTNLRNTLMRQNAIGMPTLVIRREVLNLIGEKYLDEYMPRLQDYDFVIRVSKYIEIGYVSRPLVNAFRTSNSISTNRIALYKAISCLIRKHSDFLEMEQFLGNFIASNDIMLDATNVLAEGMNMIQEALNDVGHKELNIKDMVIAYVANQSKFQRDVEQITNDYHIAKLSDGGFSIYGAGKVGQELYYKLKARGLCPKGFLVTECGEREYIDGIPIFSIDEYNDKENMILIGISKEHQVELMKNLMDRGYKEFCVCMP